MRFPERWVCWLIHPSGSDSLGSLALHNYTTPSGGWGGQSVYVCECVYAEGGVDYDVEYVAQRE